MRSKARSVMSLLINLCILLYLNNCSCIFTLASGTAEKKEPQRTFIVQSLKTENIESGTQVIINLKDGTTVKGNYLGTDTIPNENFDEEYAELQKQMPEGSFLPGKGDTVTVISEFVYQNPVKFLGFGYGNILLGGIDYDYGVRIRLRDLEKIIDKHGREIEGEEIQKLISDGKFPPLLLPEIIVEEYIPNEDGWPEFNIRKRSISINDLEDVQRGPSKSGIIQSLKNENIKSGTQAIINLKDGTIVRGKYAGIDSIYDERYDMEYTELKKQMPEGSFLPKEGDTITVISEIVYRNPLKFLGFGYDNILLSRIGDDEIVKLKLEKIEKIIDKHGKKTEREEIINLIEKPKFPFFFLSGISIEEYTGEENRYGKEITSKKFIGLNEIDQIQIKPTKNSIGNSCLSGCFIDLSIIALLFFI
jgi:small nuclear ribonucleoprotein (snRNP)-like protein